MITGQESTPFKQPLLVRFSDDENPAQNTPPELPIDPKAIAEYSAEILTELRDIASNAKLTFLAYLIQVAVEEAKIQAEERK